MPTFGETAMPAFLEVDPKILERNLLVQKDASDADAFEEFLRSPENFVKDNAPWKLVTPTAGFCVKTTDSEDKKVFINVCKTEEIPEPKEITSSELLKLWESEDVPDYRIPLSIQEPHDELDKSGNPTVVYDVAVNTNFFRKMETEEIFRSFTLQVIMEGLEDKYQIQLKKDKYVILQNRKRLGELKPHRIRTGKAPNSAPKPLIQEISPPYDFASGDHPTYNTPDFRIFINTQTDTVIGEFHLPKVVSFENLNLDVGANRIVLNSVRGSYEADFFLPVEVDETKATAKFNNNNKILTIEAPLVSSKT